MKKVINPCRINTGNKFKSQVYVAINFDETKRNLSVTGVVGPLSSGNCTGSCGQIVDELHDESRDLSVGWTSVMVDDLAEVWKEWHLNDMTSGSPRQQEFLRGKGLTYDAAVRALDEVGLLHDGEFWYDHKTRQQVSQGTEGTKPFRYGSAWIRREVPQNILDFLMSLPDATRQPAWV